jgi:chromate transport protein ChrA
MELFHRVGQCVIALNLFSMRIYLKLILYAVSFVVLFYNPFVAFVLLIGTHGLVWYFEKKGIIESQKNSRHK